MGFEGTGQCIALPRLDQERVIVQVERLDVLGQVLALTQNDARTAVRRFFK
ncbi:hypothetical protein D3C84_1099430 [compost metagenome]